MTEEDTDFRATKDVDMILLLEDRYKEFATAFWESISKLVHGFFCEKYWVLK